MVHIVSFFVLGPNDKLENKLYEIKREHEVKNKDYDVIVKVLNKTTEGCAIGCTIYHYSVELIPKE